MSNVFGERPLDAEFSAACDAIEADTEHFSVFEYMNEAMIKSGYISSHQNLNIYFRPLKSPRYGVELECTINCSKPEISGAKVASVPSTSFLSKVSERQSSGHYMTTDRSVKFHRERSDCPICPSHVGIKPGLRVWDIDLPNRTRKFFIQAPPYPYTDHHFVVIDREHVSY